MYKLTYMHDVQFPMFLTLSFLLSLLFIARVKVEGTIQGNNSGIGDIPKSRIPLTLKRKASRLTIDFLLTARIVRRSTKSLVPVLSEWVDSLR